MVNRIDVHRPTHHTEKESLNTDQLSEIHDQYIGQKQGIVTMLADKRSTTLVISKGDDIKKIGDLMKGKDAYLFLTTNHNETLSVVNE